MKIAVIGTSYVGLVTGACFADLGNEVWCVDTDERKIERLHEGFMPIYEPELESIVVRNRAVARLHFVTQIEIALREASICFITVGTPMADDGCADLQYVLDVARGIGQHMKQHLYVVNKSTVPVGTADQVRAVIQSELDARGCALTFDVISNPEFLREGSAIADCTRPDRVIIGSDNEAAAKVMRELYLPFIRSDENFIFMDIPSAEMTKYVANAMLAAKISFMNEIANICEHIGADVNKVRLGIGSDKRIGYHFIDPGCGYGGSCFPKDIPALINTSMEKGYEPEILKAVDAVNRRQKHRLSEKVVDRFGENLNGRVFAVWGLSFKPNTNDMRDAPAITVINDLTALGASVQAYDPKAMEDARNVYLRDNKRITYFDNKYTALQNCDALILMTEWNEFRSPDFSEIVSRLKSAIVFDGRNQYDASRMKLNGIDYYQIGVKRP